MFAWYRSEYPVEKFWQTNPQSGRPYRGKRKRLVELDIMPAYRYAWNYRPFPKHPDAMFEKRTRKLREALQRDSD